MKKKITSRALFGIPIGISIGYVITIIISAGWGNGAYLSCETALVEQFGSEVSAIIFQTALCALLGASCAAASVVWEVERWSIVKQTGIYFFILSVTMLPIAYFARWMERSIAGFLVYFGMFIVIFIAIWLVQYCIWKISIKRINEKVGKS
jgi:hypothetical protein